MIALEILLLALVLIFLVFLSIRVYRPEDNKRAHQPKGNTEEKK